MLYGLVLVYILLNFNPYKSNKNICISFEGKVVIEDPV